MVLCAHCNTWQHAVCYGLLSESVVPDHHTCDKCSDTDKPCTDPFLQYLSSVAIQVSIVSHHQTIHHLIGHLFMAKNFISMY